jgi:catechol 2,3-dioxygenase-like lactoylglutathione lyase family enzyme
VAQVSLTGLTLHVEDVERSTDFYTRIPGAVLVHHRPGDFALLQVGEGRLGLLSARFLAKGAPGFHMEFSSTLSGVDQLYEQVRAAGIEPDGPPANRSWGERTFHVSDPDGNRIEFDSQL